MTNRRYWYGTFSKGDHTADKQVRRRTESKVKGETESNADKKRGRIQRETERNKNRYDRIYICNMMTLSQKKVKLDKCLMYSVEHMRNMDVYIRSH